MPTYKVTDPTTGKTITLTGDSPPTEQELTEIFASVHQSAPATTAAPEQAPAQKSASDALLEGAMMGIPADIQRGIVKGLGNTVYGLGKLVHDYTPIGRISDAIQPGAFEPQNKPPELTPTNMPQKVGQTVEQIGEFFLPTGVAGKAAKAAEVAKAGALTMAQGGGPVAGGVSAGLTAVLPGGGAAKKAATSLEESAVQTMANSLRATKEWAKAESEKLAPEMLKRGIGGTFKQMRSQAQAMAAKVGANLGQAYKVAAEAGETVPGLVIQGNIQLASDALHVTAANGAKIALPGHEAAIAKLAELDQFVGKLGPDIPVDKAAAIKQAWDEIVSKAGLYGQNKMAPASEKAAAWSFREAANSFRDMLNTNPDIAALNKEAAFWIGLRDVLKATKLRKVGQTGGLLKAGGAATGMAVGGMTGDTYSERGMNAIVGGLAGQQFVKLVQSPYFMSKISAPLKQQLAEALASNSAGRIAGVTSRIVTALPAQVRAQFGAQ